jgi:hypothetical protein
MKKTAGTRQRVGFVMLLLAGACADRTYMTPTHGRSVAAAVAAQTANPEAGRKGRALPGFGAQEASIVAKNYRQSLVTKGQQSEDKGMLILAAPSANGNQPAALAPSVPERR